MQAESRCGGAGTWPLPRLDSLETRRSRVNETIERFGFPDTLVAEYQHWVVLLRPAQPTLGSLVLAAKGDAIAFSALDAAAFAELPRAIADIETALAQAV